MAAEGGNEAMKEPPKVVLRCKLCMVGDAGVGKTALTEVYTKSKFPKSYTMTSEAAFTVSTVDVAGEDVGSKSNLRVELCIFDVPGQGICREASLELVRHGAPTPLGSLLLFADPLALGPVQGRGGDLRGVRLQQRAVVRELRDLDRRDPLALRPRSHTRSAASLRSTAAPSPSDRPRRVCAGALVANKTDQEDRVFGQARMRGQQFAQGYGLQYFETSAMNSDGVNDTFEAIAKDFAQSYVEYTRRV